jgi:cobalt/nickel transport system permease protein
VTSAIEQSIFTEEHSRHKGWLQQVDPRAKLLMFLAVILAASFSRSIIVLAVLYAVILTSAFASRLPFDFFVRRVWVGIPFFAGIVIIPSIFLAPGERLFDIAIGAIHVAPSIPGLIGAMIFVVRVGVSVSLAILLILTTPWADLLKSLRTLGVPKVFILLLSMTYRYIFLFLRQVNGIFEARRSRTVGRTSGGEGQKWISGTVGSLMHRSFKMSNDVYAAMLARGFTGEIRSYSQFHFTAGDFSAIALAIVFSISIIFVERFTGWVPTFI